MLLYLGKRLFVLEMHILLRPGLINLLIIMTWGQQKLNKNPPDFYWLYPARKQSEHRQSRRNRCISHIIIRLSTGTKKTRRCEDAAVSLRIWTLHFRTNILPHLNNDPLFQPSNARGETNDVVREIKFSFELRPDLSSCKRVMNSILMQGKKLANWILGTDTWNLEKR